MEVLARIGGGGYAVVAFVIGVRLLVLAARTRRLPELLVGVSVFGLAGLGYPLSAVAREALDLSLPARSALGAMAGVFAMLGVTANTGFTWVLFRRGTSWANALLIAVGLGSAALFVVQSLRGGWATGEIFWGGLPGWITVSFGWAFVECSRYALQLRRRLRIGLADPIVTDRFALYSAATGLGVATNLVGWVFWWLHLEMLTDPVGGFLLFAMGTSSSALMLLAFLPPQAYLSWVRARTAASA